MDLAEEELRTINMGDKRIDQRAKQLLSRLASKPTITIPAACNGWSETKAAYRLLDNGAVTAECILEPHRACSLKRLTGEQIVLCIEDTTEQHAREKAEADGIEEGLVCVFSQLEPCNTFYFNFQQGRPFVNSARRKCLHIYYYFMDRQLGLIHVIVQTWSPMRMQVFVNGHSWLANKHQAIGIKFSQCENVFLWIEQIDLSPTLC